MSKFVIYQDRVGEYRWRFVAANGEIIAVSEGYTTRFGARAGAQRIKELAPQAPIVEV